ncbi:hypothetical protein TNCV_4976871 [Trichonephila clavipes]|nr:hypothetical protein TNCV_4976871 [Trichonephila clavipes]
MDDCPRLEEKKNDNSPVVLSTGTHRLLVTNGCPRLDGREKKKRCLERPNLGVLLMVQGGTSRDLTLDGVNLVIQLDPMHLKQPCHDVLKERKHENSPRRVRISKVYEIRRTKFPTLPQGFQIPEVPISSTNHSNVNKNSRSIV